MRYPNLLIAGSQKCGTTWLHAQLKKHPDVFMTDVKELNFFHKTGRSDDAAFQKYLQNFKGARDERYVGESTPHYFWRRVQNPFSAPRSHDTAEAIAEALGDDLTIIISLRDPVSRAASAYAHNFAMGRIVPGTSIFRCPPEMGLVDLGFYKRHWEHWANVFGKDRMRLLLFDDLQADPKTYLTKAYATLDLPMLPDLLDQTMLSKRIGVRRKNKLQPSVLPQEIAALLSLFEEDITFVRELSGEPLETWDNVDALARSLAQA